MKRLYKFFIGFLSKIIYKIHITKTYIAEKIAIKKKRKLYKNIRWSKDQQNEFDNYWKQHYGKRISNKWHKLYQASSGVFNIEYIPEIIYSTKIEPIFNDFYYAKVFSDKNINDIVFNNKIDNVRTPRTFLFNSNGQFYDSNRNLISKERAAELLFDVGDAVIKPTIDSSSGHNIKILHIKKGINKDGLTVEKLLTKYKQNFIIQEKIIPHKQLKKIYPKSINTFRVITYILNENVFTAPVVMRIGGGNSEIDNIHSGGYCIAVSDDGKLNKYAYKLGYGDSIEKYEQHPDTKFVFKEENFDFVNELILKAKKLHALTLNIGVISWDLTVNDKNEIILIEANYLGQSSWFPQMISGESFFGQNTKEMLKSLKNKKR